MKNDWFEQIWGSEILIKFRKSTVFGIWRNVQYRYSTIRTRCTMKLIFHSCDARDVTFWEYDHWKKGGRKGGRLWNLEWAQITEKLRKRSQKECIRNKRWQAPPFPPPFFKSAKLSKHIFSASPGTNHTIQLHLQGCKHGNEVIYHIEMSVKI